MITIHKDIEQGSPEWFALRCGSLGASSVKTAMAGGQGKSRKTLAYQLCAELVTGEKTQIPTTAAMQWGIDTEEEAREYFQLAKGLRVDQVGAVTNENFPGMHCSPDGLIGEDSGYETKCPQPATHVKYVIENRLPPEYKAQVQISMAICDRPTWWFMSYHPSFEKQLIVEVCRDEKYIEDTMTKINTFMQEMKEIQQKIGV